MNIYTYSLKSFRQNMSKGIIFMIALAVTLMSTVLNLATSMQETSYQETVAASTDAHAQFYNITEEQARLISSDDSLLWSSLRLYLHSWGAIPGQDNGIELAYEEKLGSIEGMELDSGRAPEAENEVAIPPHTAQALGLELKPGETFTLTVRNIEGDTAQYELVITGILREMKRYASFDIHIIFFSQAFMDACGSFPIEYGEDEAGALDGRNLLVHFRNGSSMDAVMEQAMALATLAGVDESDINYNESYINMKVVSPDILLIMAIFLLILLATGAIVIYNAFNMIIVKRVRQFGMLILIGASKRQVRACVYLEALLSAAVALPLGLLLGAGLSYWSLPLLSQSMGGLDLYFNINPLSYLLVTALALVMVWIGVSRPAKRAAKITPVEAVKLSPVSEKARNRREQQNVTIPALGKLNMTRNRSRTVSTILTLSISGILLLSLSTVGFSMYEGTDGMVEERYAGDIMIYTGTVQGNMYGYPRQNQLTEDMIRSIGQIDGVESVDAFYGQMYCTVLTEGEEEQNLQPMGAVIGMDGDTLSGLLDSVIEGSPTMKDLTAADVINVIAVNDYYCSAEGCSTVRLGATVPAYAVDSGEEGFTFSGKAVQLHVVGIIDAQDIPAYVSTIMGDNLPDFLMLQDVYSRTGFTIRYDSAAVTIDKDRHESIVADLHHVTDPFNEVYFESMIARKEEYKRQNAGILALLFLAVFIITLIGMLNLASSVLIGIEQRKQEFGVLSALGLSGRGLRRLLSYESIRISAISLLLSAFFGLGLGILLYHLIYQAGADYFVFTLPLVPFAVLCVLYIAVPLLVTGIAVRRLRNSTTTELLLY